MQKVWETGCHKVCDTKGEEFKLRKGMRSEKVRVLLFSHLRKGNITQREVKGDPGKEWEIKGVSEHNHTVSVRPVGR